jgi:hypothetical protein
MSASTVLTCVSLVTLSLAGQEKLKFHPPPARSLRIAGKATGQPFTTCSGPAPPGRGVSRGDPRLILNLWLLPADLQERKSAQKPLGEIPASYSRLERASWRAVASVSSRRGARKGGRGGVTRPEDGRAGSSERHS